jgi:hypothetical protein
VDKERHFLAPIAHGPSRPSVVVGGTDAVFEVVADDEVELLVVECFVDGR